MKRDIKHEVIIASLYIMLFVSICAMIQCIVERQRIIEEIENHESELKELLTKNK